MKRKKIVLIGAGSAVFTQGLVADFITANDFAKWEIALCDIDKKALNSIASLVSKLVSHKNADITISTSVDRKDLLPGADVVVTTIAVGGRRAWEDDVFIPRKYGIFQPVGDTTMPGGISRALRMIPAMLDIAHDVKALCPDAYFFNYSNPMTAICQALSRESFKVTGLCHGVKNVEQYLARFIGADPNKAKSIGAGLNHLTFLYDFRVNGQDGWPIVNETLNSQKSEGVRTETVVPFPEMGSNEPSMPLAAENPFSWEMYEKYGAFPAVKDRHITEFFPERFQEGEYYGKVLGKDAFSFEQTIANGDRRYREMHEQAEGMLEIDEKLFKRSSGEHEQLVDILQSLYRDERKLFYVNLPNRGAVPNLPSHSVLEFPAVATGNGFYPLFLADFPEQLASILRNRIKVVDLTVEAALTGDRNLFVKALLADGAVQEEKTATRLSEELLLAHKPFLPQFFK